MSGLEDMMKKCWVVDAGTVEYGEALQLQESLAKLRATGFVPDVLLLLEHPPVITFGVKDSEGSVKVSDDVLQKEGIKKHKTNRGGKVTYHGPGQLVGYPIREIDRNGKISHVSRLEEVMLRTAQRYGIADVHTKTEEDHRGTWCSFNGKDAKLAARGIQLYPFNDTFVTMHGFALNVNTNLAHFEFIHPCGVTDKGTTSLQQVLGRTIPMDEVKLLVTAIFGKVFGYDAMQPVTYKEVQEVVAKEKELLQSQQ